jgi:hypothetical protein
MLAANGFVVLETEQKAEPGDEVAVQIVGRVR